MSTAYSVHLANSKRLEAILNRRKAEIHLAQHASPAAPRPEAKNSSLGTDTSTFRKNKRSKYPATDRTLCHDCRKIDFDDIFDLRHVKAGLGRVVAILNANLEASEEASCSLCRLFACISVRPNCVSERNVIRYHLRALSFWKLFLM